MFFSKSIGGFYSTEVHGDNIPKDAVEISDVEWRSLLDGQASGKSIKADKDGVPVLYTPVQDPGSIPEFSDLEIQEELRLMAIERLKLKKEP